MGKFSLEVVPPPQKKFRLEVVPKPGSFKLEVIPLPIPEVIAPVEPVVQPKGRNRFLSKIGSLLETAKEKVESVVNFATQHRSTTLALSAAFLRFGVSKAFDLDLVTTDTVIRAGFSAGLIVEKVALPVAEKISAHFGREFSQNPVYKKRRNLFRDAVALAGGWSLASMPDYINVQQDINLEESAQSSDNGFSEPVYEQKDETQLPQRNSHPQRRDWGLPMEDVGQPDLKTETPVNLPNESQAAKPDYIGSVLGGLITNTKNFFHNGGIVFPNGSVVLEKFGNVLPTESFLPDTPNYLPESDLSVERAMKGLQEVTPKETAHGIIPGTGGLRIPHNIVGYVDIKNIDNIPDVPIQKDLSFQGLSTEVVFPVESLSGQTKTGSVAVESFATPSVSIDPQWSGLVENGENKIHNLMQKLGIEGEINHAVLTRRLQQGIRAYETGNLLDDSPIGRLFHVSNGTESLISLQTDPRFIKDLVQQGILVR